MTEQTFLDPIAHGYDRQGESEVSTTQSADDVLHKAAAHFLETCDPAKSAQAYHQAGWRLRH